MSCFSNEQSHVFVGDDNDEGDAGDDIHTCKGWDGCFWHRFLIDFKAVWRPCWAQNGAKMGSRIDQNLVQNVDHFFA